MTAYRFCRTDDMQLLVDAYAHCRGPEDEGESPLDRDGLKALVRERDLWCSSCMVALEGREPVAVLLGAKRPESTLVHALRVHPAHRRRGHGRHLLTSLGQKLAILGPPRLLAEVPAERPAACALFRACEWRVERTLYDWRRQAEAEATPSPAIAPIQLTDLEEEGAPSGFRPWHRDRFALARQEGLTGLGFCSPERLEAWLFHRGPEILLAGAATGELGARGLRRLVEELARRQSGAPLLLARAAPEELAGDRLAELGFRPVGEHLLFATEAKAA